ncbi:MAG: AAA-like domain-containing protein [Phormidium sp.]
MDIENAIALTDQLIFQKTNLHLSTLQVEIFRGAWLGQTYEEVAETCSCSITHVRRVGVTLWELLSISLGEEVNKKSFRAALERYDKVKLELDATDTPVTIVQNFSRSTRKKPKRLSVGSDQNLQFPEGPVEIGSSFYVERPTIETRCYEAILKPGGLIRIKASRQMGKTSLLTRILDHARQHQYQTVSLNLQLVDSNIFLNLDRFLQWFCAIVTRKLQLPLNLAAYWDDVFGSKTSCKDYFESYLLPQLEQPLVLALDEVDAIFPYPEIADNFFALLRAWYEEAKNSDVWRNLRLVLVHSTEVYIPLNINQSPFNVGLPIELPELSIEQVKELAELHNLNWNDRQIDLLMNMIGGHPYLVRVALYHIAHHQMPLEEFLQLAPTESSPYSDHLRRHLLAIEQQPKLAIALKTLLATTESVELPSLELFQLNRMGLIHLKDNQVTLRCELYRQYFRDRL